jgi:CBS domain-containing protein
MLVEKRMRKNPETITPEDYLASALAKMHKGGFRTAIRTTPLPNIE